MQRGKVIVYNVMIQIITTLFYSLIQLIKQQMPEDYAVHTETPMQFDNLEAALELTVDKAEAQGKGWTIALVSKKV